MRGCSAPSRKPPGPAGGGPGPGRRPGGGASRERAPRGRPAPLLVVVWLGAVLGGGCIDDITLPACRTLADCPPDEGFRACRHNLCFRQPADPEPRGDDLASDTGADVAVPAPDGAASPDAGCGPSAAPDPVTPDGCCPPLPADPTADADCRAWSAPAGIEQAAALAIQPGTTPPAERLVALAGLGPAPGGGRDLRLALLTLDGQSVAPARAVMRSERVLGPLVTAAGRAYVAGDGGLYCAGPEAAAGRLLLTAPQALPPAADAAGTVVAVDRAGQAFFVRSDDTVADTLELPDAPGGTSPPPVWYGPGGLAIVAADTALLGLAAPPVGADAHVQWRMPLEAAPSGAGLALSAAGRVVVALADGHLAIFDAQTGAPRAAARIAAPIEADLLILPADVLVARGGDGVLHGFALDSDTLQQRFSLAPDDAPGRPLLVCADQTLWLAGATAVRRLTPTPEGAFALDADFTLRAVPTGRGGFGLAAGYWLVPTAGAAGPLQAWPVPCSGLGVAPWPKFQRDEGNTAS